MVKSSFDSNLNQVGIVVQGVGETMYIKIMILQFMKIITKRLKLLLNGTFSSELSYKYLKGVDQKLQLPL